MSQRRIKAAKLSDNAYSTNYPSPTERSLDVSSLNGGLNLWELDYRLDINQSPDCVNVYWKDGCLSSRRGQEYLYQESATVAFIDCYKTLWQNFIVAHVGTKLYKINPATGTHSELCTDLTSTKGAGFFVFGDNLYYLGGGKYKQITTTFATTDVVVHIPTVVVNRTPSGTGGDAYQPENRLAAGKKVLFTADGTSTTYSLPYTGLDSTTVTARINTYSGGSYNWVTKYEGTDFTVNRTTGVVTFNTAPPQQTVTMPNNVEITCYKTDSDAVNSVLTCTCAIVYGGNTELTVVVGGSPSQPNVFMWTGNDENGVNPGYFPYTYYNYAGADAHQYICGFGRQQDLLIILSEHSVGKSTLSSTTVDDRTLLSLPYYGINSAIGCDIPGTVQLVQNNLVFANTYGGVYILADTSAADENNVKRISRNVNGDPDDPVKNNGLLYDIRYAVNNSQRVSSFDDQQRYWLVANGHAYLWDYTITSYASKEEKLSWFYFDNINSAGWCNSIDDDYYFKSNGSIVKMIENFVDFEAGFLRKYTFATQHFGSYERLKDVMKVIFAVRTDTDTAMAIKYTTDYESRADLTPITGFAWRLVPRNLAHRSLNPLKFAFTAVRIPRCFHIKHFKMTLTNSNPYSDMSIVNAQIIYRYVRKDR